MTRPIARSTAVLFSGRADAFARRAKALRVTALVATLLLTGLVLAVVIRLAGWPGGLSTALGVTAGVAGGVLLLLSAAALTGSAQLRRLARNPYQLRIDHSGVAMVAYGHESHVPWADLDSAQVRPVRTGHPDCLVVRLRPEADAPAHHLFHPRHNRSADGLEFCRLQHLHATADQVEAALRQFAPPAQSTLISVKVHLSEER